MTTALHEARLAAVGAVLVATGARRIADLGCGDGPLAMRLAAAAWVERLVAVDVDAAALDRLRGALAEAPLRAEVVLVEGSYLEPSAALDGVDTALMIETIEHLAPERLGAVERAVFARLAPDRVVVTTPNADFNRWLGVPPHRRRHPEHRFEWGRARFRAWARGVGRRHGYATAFHDIGGAHPVDGGASQMAVFLRDAAQR